MMRVVGLVLVLAFVMGGACLGSTTVTKNVYPGWQMVATPVALYDTSVGTAYSNVLNQWSPVGRNCLYGMNPATGQTIYDPRFTTFGGVLLGQGYMLKVKTQTTVSYTGFDDGLPDASTPPVQTDMWISLPGAVDGGGNPVGSWHYVGQPFNHNTPDSAILFTDGIDVKTWSQAVTANWVSNAMSGMDSAGGFTTSYDMRHNRSKLEAGCGYQFLTKKGNLAMIVPALPTTP